MLKQSVFENFKSNSIFSDVSDLSDRISKVIEQAAKEQVFKLNTKYYIFKVFKAVKSSMSLFGIGGNQNQILIFQLIEDLDLWQVSLVPDNF